MIAGGTGRKIALLDLHARADVFQETRAMGALASRLEQRGHDVTLLASVLASEPGGVDAWHAQLARFVREGAYDVVALARAWDPATVTALRAALVDGAKLVRLTSGVAAAIDGRFDHVLDEGGLVALLEGTAEPRTAAWRPMRAAELRMLPRASADDAPMAAVDLGGRKGAARPTISGPAVGCPFLLDATKNPLYARLDVDKTRVQMRGCTFCLDNSGAYVALGEDEVVGSWMTQLRRVGGGATAPREVLLTDERPHPYFPALLRALMAEPALGRFEILWKSRIDWLLEYAEGPVAEALALAEQAGHVLHLYLVGFESFDQFHLDLFNKGYRVEDNVRAIAKMRELGARFPRSFEYRRHRAHGIVLFTPWTRPESLLENARIMREVGFDELRADSISTRLRLYPRVPLHALAEADGLLAGEFAEGRGDRAAEQGYDASVPWRFQDARTEAIFQVAGALRRDRHLPDPDALEAATRFVLRFPGLSAVPADAHLPLRRSLQTWGIEAPEFTASLGCGLYGVDPELEAIRAGVKRAALKESVPKADLERLVGAYRAMGFASDVVSRHGLVAGSDTHQDGRELGIVAVGVDEDALTEVLVAQRALAESGSDEALASMGALMGYPPCCVQAFAGRRSRRDNLENERQPFRRSPDEPLTPVLNRLARLRLISHHLCSPSCEASNRIAEAVLSQIEAVHPAAAAWIRAEVERPVLFVDYERQCELDGTWEGDEFVLDATRPSSLSLRLGVAFEVARITLLPDGVVFAGRAGERASTRARSPLLVVPGRPLSPAARAALGAPEEGGPEPAARRDAPALPSAFRAGVRVRDYRIESVRRHARGHEIVLASGQHRFTMIVRAHDPAVAFTVRRGPWAIDVDAAESLPDPARAAVSVIVRGLPA